MGLYNFLPSFYNLYNSLFSGAYSAWNKIDNFISPPYCSFCRDFIENREVFCLSCFEKIEPIAPYMLNVGKASLNNLTFPIYSAASYKDPIKSLIRDKHKSSYLASYNLAKLIYSYSTISKLEFDYLVPIPLHWTRNYYRGYNQAEVIAQHLGILLNKPVVNILKRVKKTKLQAYLDPREREINLDKAFILNKKAYRYKGKKIVLVDDLMTTGSTFMEAALVLKKIKPSVIYGCVACRVI